MRLIQDHPRGLSTLFFTEMWERFSYYGMRALLVLYLVNALEYPRAQALQVYATYTALVYVTPILGGYLADRWLGARRAVLIGALVMSMGHFAMAAPSMLHLALGLLIAGNGFFKPNISTLVGGLYGRGDSRRDSGFTIFYMGINLGALFSPIVCGTLGEKFGWHYGFAAAGVGMLIALWVFSAGQRRFDADPGTGAPPSARDWSVVGAVSLGILALVGGTILLWPWLKELWQASSPAARLGFGLGLLALAVVDRSRRPAPSLSREEWHRVFAIVIIGLFVIFFWMGFEQAGGTMNLFADKQTDRTVFGWLIPASYFQSINPLAILILAPLFSILWVRLDNSRFAISVVAKQALGMIILGLGFVLLAVADARSSAIGLVSPAWLVGVYVLFTAGELCLSPIGLSMVTKLAPQQLVAFMMGIWFTTIALANYLAGTLEALLQNFDIPLYWFLVASSIGAGALLLLLSPFIQRLMHGIR